MPAIIHAPLQFSKKIQRMSRAGNKPTIAARQAQEIINTLANKNHLSHDACSKLSKNGEARIKNCLKFNLAGGHRMVAIKQEGWFVFLFLGTHDEADKWIKNNMDIRLEPSQGEIVPPSRSAAKNQIAPESTEIFEHVGPASIHDLDVPLDKILDQKTLREIFSGICAPTKVIREEA